jgi:hypothetical protein
MVQLRSCYFCGTTGALSAYDALPSALRGDGDAPRQVILCDRCHTKLETVLAPLVDGAEPAAVRDPGTAHERERGRAVDAPDEQSPAHEEPTNQPEVTFSQPATPAADDGSDDRSTPTAVADTTDGDADADERADAPGDGTVPADGTESDGQTAADEGEMSVDETTPAHEQTAASGTGHTAADSNGDDENEPAAANLDRVYHKLLRFLRNREFPIPRGEAEAIAQSAYDLSTAEASQVIQRTVDRGVLEERDGELHRR